MNICRQTKMFLEHRSKARSRELLNLPRNLLRTVTGIITGHNTLSRHMNIMGLNNDQHSRSARSAHSAPPAVHMLEVNGSELMAPGGQFLSKSFCLYYLNCQKCGQLTTRKIIEIVATRCQILRIQCIKFDFGWGSAPDPTGGAYSAPQIP